MTDSDTDADKCTDDWIDMLLSIEVQFTDDWIDMLLSIAVQYESMPSANSDCPPLVSVVINGRGRARVWVFECVCVRVSVY